MTAGSPNSAQLRPSGLPAAVLFLWGRIHPNPPETLVHWLVPLSIVIGLLWVGTFRASWKVYGDPDVTRDRSIPALAVVSLECLLTGRSLVGSIARANARSGSRDESSLSIAATALYLLALLVLIAGIPDRVGWYPPVGYWRRYINPLYPQVTYRPILLAPIWGRWSILLAGCVGRVAPGAEPSIRLICNSIRPGVVLRWALVPFVLTAIYTRREDLMYHGLYAGLIVFLVVYVAAVLLARRNNGQSAQSLFACGAIGQLAFLAAYRALCVK